MSVRRMCDVCGEDGKIISNQVTRLAGYIIKIKMAEPCGECYGCKESPFDCVSCKYPHHSDLRDICLECFYKEMKKTK
jgi:hypothetical protein